MRILVTGGAGYIGSHASKALRRAGYEPVVYDNLIYGHRDCVRWGPFEEGDIRDGQRLDEVMEIYRPEIVLHFAALAYVGESLFDPQKYYENNIVGSINLLAAMRRHNINRIVFSSTCATYGIPSTLPIVEEMPQHPINPYGFSKLVIENALADYGRAYGLSWTALRYFNAAGCDPEGELGERHEPETHAIPLAIKAALGTAPRFSVFGADYETPDGSAVRDYIHVADLADAHVKAVSFLLSGGASQAFNLATGQGTSVLRILEAVEKALGCPVPKQLSPRRPGDPPALYASAERAARVLNWTPRFVDIDETVETAAKWFSRQEEKMGGGLS